MISLPRPARSCAPAINRVIRRAKSALQVSALQVAVPKVAKTRRRLKAPDAVAPIAVPAE